MVQSKAVSVDEWMGEIEPARRPVFERLRGLCRERLTGWQEGMHWGMPGYGPVGSDCLVAFNSQKRHLAFYAGEVAVERFASDLAGVDCGKGCVRYRKPEQVDFAVVAAMLDDIRARH